MVRYGRKRASLLNPPTTMDPIAVSVGVAATKIKVKIWEEYE
jgi:hypothetical protein